MVESNISTLDALILKCEDVDFAPKKDWDQGDLIATAETDLGFTLPKSYKWWLNHYKGGSVGFDQEIYSLYGESAAISSSDLVQNHQKNPRHALLPENALVFFAPYGEEIFFFDVQRGQEEYEIFVVWQRDRLVEFYSGDFIEFLIKYINGLMGNPVT